MSTKYTRARFGAAVVVAFLCGLVFASGFDLTKFSWAQTRLTSAANKPSAAQVASAAETETAFEAVADHARPAVVSIETERFARSRPMSNRRGRGQPQGQQDLPPGIEDFFRQFDGGQTQPSDQPEEASGSGCIVSNDGYILTNNHVVDGADDIKVDVTDGRTLTAKVVGTDAASDLALLKVGATDLHPIAFGNSDGVQVGDVVLAVGNPLGVGQTVTMGIISAKGRQTDGDGKSFEDFLQTDAPINHGNSGGALVNTKGELVGINSQIASVSDGNIGIGFAIPANMAKHVMTDLRTDGKVRRGQLGVSIQPVTSDLAESLGLKQVGGVIISSVTPGSAADHAGLKRDDIIKSFNGQPVQDINSLRNHVADLGPGASATLTVDRDGKDRVRPHVHTAF